MAVIGSGKMADKTLYWFVNGMMIAKTSRATTLESEYCYDALS